MKPVLLAFIAMTFGLDAGAELLPQAFGGDSRIREVLYDPNQVLKLDGAALPGGRAGGGNFGVLR